jgi:tetratricopeptide (TPR) repeat protein
VFLFRCIKPTAKERWLDHKEEQCYLDSNHVIRVISAFVDVFPDNTTYLKTSIDLHVARGSNTDWSTSLYLLETLLKLDPAVDSDWLKTTRDHIFPKVISNARVFSESNQPLDKPGAVGSLELVNRMAPASTDFTSLAKVYEANSDLDAAIRLYTRELVNGSTVTRTEINVRLAQLYTARGRYSDATAAIESALSQATGYPHLLHWMRMDGAMRDGRYSAAAKGADQYLLMLDKEKKLTEQHKADLHTHLNSGADEASMALGRRTSQVGHPIHNIHTAYHCTRVHTKRVRTTANVSHNSVPSPPPPPFLV